MKGDDDFVKLGAAHAAAGMPRYRFQEPHLQALYDKGYELHDHLLEPPQPAVIQCQNCSYRYRLIPHAKPQCPDCGYRPRY